MGNVGITAYKLGQMVAIPTVGGEVFGIIAGPGSIPGSRFVQTETGAFWEVKLHRGAFVVTATPEDLTRRTRLLHAIYSAPVVSARWGGGYMRWSTRALEILHRGDCSEIETRPEGWPALTYTDTIARATAVQYATTGTPANTRFCACLTGDTVQHDQTAHAA